MSVEHAIGVEKQLSYCYIPAKNDILCRMLQCKETVVVFNKEPGWSRNRPSNTLNF